MTYSTEALVAQTILIIEDHYLVADFVSSVVASVGASFRGPFESAEGALTYLLGTTERFDAATVNVDLSDGPSFPVADELTRMGIPFVFLTESSTDTLPGRFSSVPLLRKPFAPTDIVEVLRGLIDESKAEQLR